VDAHVIPQACAGLARDVARDRIVLLSSEGLTGPEIAERVGCSEPTVVLWRRRFAHQGLPV
jgi:transposase